MPDITELTQLLETEQEPDLAEIAAQGIAKPKVLALLREGLVSKNEILRYNCFRALLQIGKQAPGLLYPSWDYLAGLLGSANAFHRSIAVQLLAEMTAADTEQRFAGLFERYFGLLDDDKVMVSRSLVQNAGRIMVAQPHLAGRIVAALLDVDKTRHPQSRKELLKSDIVAFLDEVYDELPDKDAAVAFAGQQLTSSSPSTRKSAQAFLKAHCK